MIYKLNINYFQILEEAAESVVNPELAVKYSLPVNDWDNCLLIETESISYSENVSNFLLVGVIVPSDSLRSTLREASSESGSYTNA